MPESESYLANISSLGERALVVRLGDRIDVETFRRVHALSRQLEDNRLAGIIECVPAFTTVTVYFDPLQRTTIQMRQALEQALAQLDVVHLPPQRAVSIPVCYGGDFGEDLEFVAGQRGLTCAEVIEIHSGVEYLVYMLGFAPGFPYLGGMSPRIATPRRETPRVKTPAGSVGIAGEQTGVYPIETPGGWQLIGRTPLALFRPQENPPTLLLPGDTVRFAPITAQQFHDMCEYPR